APIDAYFFFPSTAVSRPLRSPCETLLLRLTISMHATAASQPLLPDFAPDRSIACSTVSQVSTPKLIAHWDESASVPIPLATSEERYSKCGAPPRITAPRQITPTYPPCSATRRARPASSNAPGTRKTSMSSSATPCLKRASSAPRSNSSVTKALKRDTQTANRPLGGARLPSK